MFVSYDLFIQITHTIFFTDSMMNGSNNSLELSPELFNGIRVDHKFSSFTIGIAVSKFSFWMIICSVVIVNTSNRIGDSHICTKERARSNSISHYRPQCTFFYIRNHLNRYSSRISLNDTKNNLLIVSSTKPCFICFSLSRKERLLLTSFLKKSLTYIFE